MLSNSGFSNPFSSHAANGIMLRLPWCGFQVGPASGQQPPKTTGQCHYQVLGASGTGTYVAGQFASGALQFSKQQVVDPEIGDLSPCSGVIYDTCGSSLLSQALGYIATIDAAAGGNLVLSISLEAGQYTPQSLLDATAAQYVGYVDLPKYDPISGSTYCTRQPLAWQTAYVLDYTVTMNVLLKFIRGLRLKLPPAEMLKQAAITTNSSEFNIAARTAMQPTAIDPASPSGGPQGDPAIQCPDHTSAQTGVAALLGRYNASGTAKTGINMANA
jgi:hypothetical protein